MGLSEWSVGVLLNIFGGISINLGTNLIKLSYVRRLRSYTELSIDDKPITVRASVDKAARKSRTWALGMFSFIAGNALNFASFAYAAQSVLAALGAFEFVCNVFFGKVLLNEPITLRLVGGTSLIMTGTIISMIFSDHSETAYSLVDLEDYYYSPLYITYMAVLALLTMSCQTYLTLVNRPGCPPVSNAIQAVLYSFVSATVGTQSVVFAKSLSVIVFEMTQHGFGTMKSWFTYIIIFSWVASMSFWLYRMNNALKTFHDNNIIPVLLTFWILFSIISGGVYFQEFTEMSLLHALLFSLGVILSVTGVIVMTLTPSLESGKYHQERASTEGLLNIPLVDAEDNESEDNIYQNSHNPLAAAALGSLSSLTMRTSLGEPY